MLMGIDLLLDSGQTLLAIMFSRFTTFPDEASKKGDWILTESDILNVRNAGLKDISELCALYLGQSQPVRRFFHPFPFEKNRLRLIFLLMILSNRLVNTIKKVMPRLAFVIIIAYDTRTTEIVGFTYFRITRKKSDKYIAGVGVTTREDLHMKGVGTKLYTALIRRAKEIGVIKFWATILKDNMSSIALHKKCGFEIVGEAPDDSWDGKSEKNLRAELDLVNNNSLNT